MPLQLGLAVRKDAPRIAEIHMAGLGHNGMLQAQFPSPSIRNALQKSIEEKTIAELDDYKVTVLVVRDSDNVGSHKSDVVAFAKWYHPVYQGENYVEEPWNWPAGTDNDLVDAWTRKMEAAQRVALGDSRAYVLTFLIADPQYHRQGAGSMLLRWGIEQSRRSGIPVYLESTVESAPFYERLGLTSKTTLTMDLIDHGSDQIKTYREIAYIYRPVKSSRPTNVSHTPSKSKGIVVTEKELDLDDDAYAEVQLDHGRPIEVSS